MAEQHSNQLLWRIASISGFNHAVISLGVIFLAPLLLHSHYFDILNPFSMATKLKILGALMAVKPICEALTAFICSRYMLNSMQRLFYSCLIMITFSLIMFASAIAAGQLLLLFVAQICLGIGTAVIFLIQTLINQRITISQQARAFNVLEWSIALGLLLGPMTGSWLAHLGSQWQPQIAYWIFVVVAIALFAIAAPKIFTPTAGPEPRKRYGAPINILDYIAWFCFMCGWHGYFYWFPTLLMHHLGYTTAGVGKVFTYMGLCYVICQFGIVRRFTHLRQHRRIVLWALPIIALCIATMPLASPVLLYVILVIYMLAIAFLLPFWKAYVSARSWRDSQRLFGMMTALTTLSSVVASFSGGFLSAYSITLTFSLSAILILLALVFLCLQNCLGIGRAI